MTFSSSKILNSVVSINKDQDYLIKNIKKKYNFEYIENNIFKKIANENILVFVSAYDGGEEERARA